MLRAISVRLETERPHGAAAVELLVAAVPLLRGGISALAQYGEAKGCDPADVAAAERAARTRA